jgi:hypothetical protein
MNKELKPFQVIIKEIQALSQQEALIEKHQVALYSLANQLTALIDTLDLILNGHLDRPYNEPTHQQVTNIIGVIKKIIEDTEIEIRTDPSFWHQYIKPVLNRLIDVLNVIFVQLNLTPMSPYETKKTRALHQWTLNPTPDEKSLQKRLEDHTNELSRIYPKIKNG